MAVLYIIAGPPCVGKSTSGFNYVPDTIPVLDEDLISHKYKLEGFSDYKPLGNLRFRHALNSYINSKIDFAIELNLGFESHYEVLKKFKGLSHDNRIEVILFHTNDLQLCLDRAKIRHENGLHFVAPEIIKEMYDNTLPLLKQNIELLSGLICVDVIKDEIAIERILKYDRLFSELKIIRKPEWLSNELTDLLERYTQNKKINQSQKLESPTTARVRRKRPRL